MTAAAEERRNIGSEELEVPDKPTRQPGTASVVKALQLMDVFRDGRPALGVSDIARRAGVPTSTAHRLLSYLVQGGFVVKDGTNYLLADKLFELGNRVSHSRPTGLRELAGPYLGEVYAATGMTAHLAVLDDTDIVIIDKITGLRSFPVRTSVGGRSSATCTALGKAMLAFEATGDVEKILCGPLTRRTRYSLAHHGLLRRQLHEVHSTRLAFDREESTIGQICVAAPIIQNGRAVAAMSISGAAQTFDAVSSARALGRVAAQVTLRLAA